MVRENLNEAIEHFRFPVGNLLEEVPMRQNSGPKETKFMSSYLH